MIQDFLKSFSALPAYFALAASLALLARRLMKMPGEVFRKMLHLVLLFSLPVFLYAFPTWLSSVIAALAFAAAAYPLLAFLERYDGYSELLAQRKSGEIKRSLMLVFLMFAAIISLCSLLAFLQQPGDKGNVVPGLAIAILGVLTNSWFWLRYRKLDREGPNAILEVQSRLYRAKSLVDICVTAALLSVALFPGSQGAYYMDATGSLVVAAYLIMSGAGIIRGKARKLQTV